MTNGTQKDPKNIIFVVDGTAIPSEDFVDFIEITPPTDNWTVENGIASGYEYKRQYQNDEKVTIKLFQRNTAFDLERKYDAGGNVNIYIKDINTNRAYGKSDCKIGTMDSYTIGTTTEMSFTFLTPGLKKEFS
jgi:hypothetical protein